MQKTHVNIFAATSLSAVASLFLGTLLYRDWTVLYFVWLAAVIFVAVPLAFSSKNRVAIAGGLGLVVGTCAGPLLFSIMP
jgi:hypothetical protein